MCIASSHICIYNSANALKINFPNNLSVHLVHNSLRQCIDQKGVQFLFLGCDSGVPKNSVVVLLHIK